VLFNSYVFLFVFLPAAILSYRLVDPYPPWRVPWLLVLSLTFYGYWDWRFLALLVPSILINWMAARAYLATRRGAVVAAAIVGNLAVLGFVKYGRFFASNLSRLTGLDFAAMDVALPLGISFFTFHHIMYLVDLRRGIAPAFPLGKYALYICFFPQVLSGPLVRWSEVMDQFGRAAFAKGWEPRCATAAALIILGLAQKTLLADPLAVIVEPLFRHAENAAPPDGTAWVAVLGFTFQIFFDFSAYSDIAIGTALIFGIRLPLNFDGPYRATSVREFWRRWHMTLSRFLRDYLYIPLGGNRHGLARQLLAILITMALGGLWHGAGWGFVLWGVLHGCAIAVVTLWNRLKAPLPALAGWLLTFWFVALTWVFFRAASLDGAVHMLEGLAVSPIGRDLGGWRTIAIAAFCAIVLPPTHEIARRLTARAWPSVAFALAVLGIVVVAQLGRVQNYEFIYFKF
jgi:alginate O-acetyltransferase complex protein AlgI